MTKRPARPRRVKALATGGKWALQRWELPRTAAAYDAMVEQMAKAYCEGSGYPTSWKIQVLPGIRDALRSIGITRPKD